jgi:hypothetical protein
MHRSRMIFYSFSVLNVELRLRFGHSERLKYYVEFL